MTTRKRAPVRRRALARPNAKSASRLQKARIGGARQAAYRTFAAELLANVRQRYEETPEPVPLLAADLGILPTSFYRLARDKGWARRNDLPARDVPPAMKILEEAKALEADGVRRLSGCSEAPPTPDPSPPLAKLAGGGERAESVKPSRAGERAESAGRAVSGIAAPPELSTIERLERAVLAELATIEAMRAALGTLPQKPPGAARTVRTLSMLTQTLQHLQRLRASAALAAKPPVRSDHDDDSDDDMPRDLDEFRRDLARRIDAFVKSRADRAGDRGDADATTVVET
jgi:hypothetical protein